MNGSVGAKMVFQPPQAEYSRDPRGAKAVNFDYANERRRQNYLEIKQTGIKKARGRPKLEQGVSAQAKGRLERTHQLKNEKEQQLQLWKLTLDNPTPPPGYEELHYQFAQTQWGRRQYPMAAKLIDARTQSQAALENVRALVADAGRKHRADLVAKLVRGPLTRKFFCQFTGLSAGFVTGAVDRQMAEDAKEPAERRLIPLFTEQMIGGVKRNAKSSAELRMHECFFLNETDISSGSSTMTREVRTPLSLLFIDLYAQYPAMLRQASQEEGVYEKYTKKKTRFGQGMKAARLAAARPGWSLATELADRTDRGKKWHAEKTSSLYTWGNHDLDESNDSLAAQPSLETSFTFTFSPVISADQMEEEWDKHYDPVPMCQETFWKHLKLMGIKWKFKANPTSCDLHDNGPTWLVTQREMQDAINGLHAKIKARKDNVVEVKTREASPAMLEMQLNKLYGEKKKIDTKAIRYLRHLKQYESARPWVKHLEKHLKVGECLVYRDFVNQHTGYGNKMNNLVLVFLWRDHPDQEQLHCFKLNHFCGDKATRSCDAFFVRDVFRLHLEKGENRSGLFSLFHTMYVSGDHGPHFSSIETVYHESTWWSKYQIRVHIVSLCSYHAYNRCDGAGVESKRLSRQIHRETLGHGPRYSSHFTKMTNESSYGNTFAVNFPTIDKSRDAFPKDLDRSGGFALKTMNEIIFDFTNEEGLSTRQDGIVLCRQVSGGNDPFEVFDLIKRAPIDAICEPCSKANQRPIYHRGDYCPNIGKRKAPKDFNLGTTVDDSRFTGPQDGRVSKGKGKKGGLFVCRSPDCSENYKYASGANKHMMDKHLYVAGDPRLFPAQVRNKPKKKASAAASSSSSSSSAVSGAHEAANEVEHEDANLANAKGAAILANCLKLRDEMVALAPPKKQKSVPAAEAMGIKQDGEWQPAAQEDSGDLSVEQEANQPRQSNRTTASVAPGGYREDSSDEDSATSEEKDSPLEGEDSSDSAGEEEENKHKQEGEEVEAELADDENENEQKGETVGVEYGCQQVVALCGDDAHPWIGYVLAKGIGMCTVAWLSAAEEGKPEGKYILLQDEGGVERQEEQGEKEREEEENQIKESVEDPAEQGKSVKSRKRKGTKLCASKKTRKSAPARLPLLQQELPDVCVIAVIASSLVVDLDQRVVKGTMGKAQWGSVVAKHKAYTTSLEAEESNNAKKKKKVLQKKKKK